MARATAGAILLAGGALATPGCSGPAILRVTSYWGEAINLYGTGRTFAWAPRNEGEPLPHRNPSFDSVLREAVSRVMQRKGYVHTEPGSADMWLDYRVGMEVSQPRATIEYVEEASLAIDVLEPRSRRIIWVGTALVRLDHSTPPHLRRKRIQSGVSRVLAQFPDRDRD